MQSAVVAIYVIKFIEGSLYIVLLMIMCFNGILVLVVFIAELDNNAREIFSGNEMFQPLSKLKKRTKCN